MITERLGLGRRTWKVARWEFLGTLRNRQFLFLTTLFPLLLLGSAFVTMALVTPELRESLPPLLASTPEDLKELLEPLLQSVFGVGLDRLLPTLLAGAIAFVFLFVVLFSGTFVLQNVIREKQSRMVERILAAITPRELIAGKILAFGALGLVQAAIWVAVGLSLLLVVGPYWGLPTWPLLGLLLSYMPWGKLLLFVAFFVLGYLFIASFSAAMGSTMTDVFSGQQTQSLLVVLPAVLPLSLINLLISNPQTAVYKVLSYFPPSIPGAMMLRMARTEVPPWEVLTSLLVLLLSTVLMVRLAGKIFEVGILMYGKSLSLREIGRWIRG